MQGELPGIWSNPEILSGHNKMDYKFQNLLGAPYKGGSVAMTGDTLLTPVGNRVSQVRMACNSPDTPGL